MDYCRLTLSEIKRGYHFDEGEDAFICNYCGKAFQKGQVFLVSENLLNAENAVDKHIEVAHDGNYTQLINIDTKYNTFTDNQKELLSLFNSGISDNEIAKKLDVSVSIIRQQKFSFIEMAKRYKFYLAVYENVFDGRMTGGEAIASIHNNAKYYDDRYVITEKERSHILETFFESMNPLTLKCFPAKEKNKVIILSKIAEQFKIGQNYTEKEVNLILKSVYNDINSIRRYLIMYGFMERTKDGSSYWLAD
ncbi:MAG: DUF2087 domain-containing protein [Prevotella sp.]|jgi:hypothetical protein|nr:DUF2087 domain-containing protein [Prevotella sp.]